MKRLFALSVLIVCRRMAPPPISSRRSRRGRKSFWSRKLKDNLYVFRGDGGGETSPCISAQPGVTVVDAKNPGWGTPILDKIKELTPKPVTLLINTHTHGDHVSGNVEFPATVDIVVQENTKINMEKMEIFTKNNGRGLPKRTFKDKMTIGSGKDRFDLYYFGRGHTNGDAFIVFPELRVMHAGDIFSARTCRSSITTTAAPASRSATRWRRCTRASRTSTRSSPATARMMTWADLAEWAQFNKDFLSDVQAAKKAGKSADDLAASWTIPEKLRGEGLRDQYQP